MTSINNSHPDSCPALVLNADFRPLSYYPLSLWSWQDAIKAVYLERVNIVSTYDLSIQLSDPESWPHSQNLSSLLAHTFALQEV